MIFGLAKLLIFLSLRLRRVELGLQPRQGIFLFRPPRTSCHLSGISSLASLNVLNVVVLFFRGVKKVAAIVIAYIALTY